MSLLSLALGSGDRYRRVAHVRAQSSECFEDESDSSGLWNAPASIDEHHQNKANFVPKNRTLAYTRKQVLQLDGDMKLYIRKMDGATFDVEVAETATVQDLKAAVERRFEGDISWPHVWENFCLSYMNQKLIAEKLLLHQFGIRGDDELYFVRHLAVRQPEAMSQSRKRFFFNGMRKK